MKAFSMQPIFPGMNIQENVDKADSLMKSGLPYNPFIWEPYREIDPDAYIRDRFVQY